MNLLKHVIAGVLIISHHHKLVFPKLKSPSLVHFPVTQSGSHTATRKSDTEGSQSVTDADGPGLQDQQLAHPATRRSKMPSNLVSAQPVILGKRSLSFETTIKETNRKRYLSQTD